MKLLTLGLLLFSTSTFSYENFCYDAKRKGNILQLEKELTLNENADQTPILKGKNHGFTCFIKHKNDVFQKVFKKEFSLLRKESINCSYDSRQIFTDEKGNYLSQSEVSNIRYKDKYKMRKLCLSEISHLKDKIKSNCSVYIFEKKVCNFKNMYYERQSCLYRLRRYFPTCSKNIEEYNNQEKKCNNMKSNLKFNKSHVVKSVLITINKNSIHNITCKENVKSHSDQPTKLDFRNFLDFSLIKLK